MLAVVSMFLVLGFVLLVLSLGYFIESRAQGEDTEILSGKVVGKSREVVSCEHSYPCRCRQECSGRGNQRSCFEVCDICYEHPFDVDWDVKTTVGTISIDRLDSQGLAQPPRWTKVKNDEPVSKVADYENYVKAVPGALYTRISTEPTPPYPGKIYDYYHVDRVVDWHANIPEADLKSLNEQISLDLREVSPVKQVNLVVVVTSSPTSMFAENLKAAWLGGKKNDVVLVIGLSQYPSIAWVSVFSWSSDDLLNIKLRDAVLAHGNLDVKAVDLAVTDISKLWTRRHMSEFKYLKHEIKPSSLAYILIFLIGLLSAFAAVVVSLNVNESV